jgi:hypothetical protein
MRRLPWIATGFGLGVVVAHRATRGGTQPVLVTTATGLATRVRRTVEAAIADGRAEMHRREASLREVFGSEVFGSEDFGSDGASPVRTSDEAGARGPHRIRR